MADTLVMQVVLKEVRGGALAALESRLSGEEFQAYRNACNAGGARWSKDDNGNWCSASRAQALVHSLTAAGFQVRIDGQIPVGRARKDRTREILARVEELKSRGFTADPYQIEGATWLANRSKGLLTDDPGLGKTLQALLIMNPSSRLMVCSPATVKPNWLYEGLKRFRPDLRYTILDGMKSFRWAEPGEVVILNYDILPGHVEGFCRECKEWSRKCDHGRAAWSKRRATAPEAPPNVVFVADECHLVKSAKATRTMLLKALLKNVREAGGDHYGLTGTEMLNRPNELWTIYTVFDLHEDAFGTYANFQRVMGAREISIGGVTIKQRTVIEWGTPEAEVVEMIRRVSLKRLKRDVIKDLPSLRYQLVPVEIDAKTKKICDEVVAHLKSKGIDLNDVHQIVDLTKIKGAGFELLSRAMTALAIAKMDAAMDEIESYEEAGVPLIVFSAHRAPVDILAKREGWAVITGDTPNHPHQESVPVDCTCRQAIAQRFQDGKLKGIAGTISAMGVGINLFYGSNILRIDRDWTPGLNTQAVARAWRRGQKSRGVLCKDLIANHALETRLSVKLIEKEDVIESTVDAAARQVGEVDTRPVGSLEPVVAPPAPPAPPAAKSALSFQPPIPFGAQTGPFKARRRGPKDATELWAARGLVQLAGDDQDHASEENGVGFSKMDNTFGHSLAAQASALGLSEAQWEHAVRLCRRYRGQLVSEPKETH